MRLSTPEGFKNEPTIYRSRAFGYLVVSSVKMGKINKKKISNFIPKICFYFFFLLQIFTLGYHSNYNSTSIFHQESSTDYTDLCKNTCRLVVELVVKLNWLCQLLCFFHITKCLLLTCVGTFLFCCIQTNLRTEHVKENTKYGL